jgi:hypothetical protein
MMQTISRNRFLLFALIALGLVAWMLVTQSQLPALSAPKGAGSPS